MNIVFRKAADKLAGTLVVAAQSAGKKAKKQEAVLLPAAAALDKKFKGQLRRAAASARFSGKKGGFLEILAPAPPVERIILAGLGDPDTHSTHDYTRLGGALAQKLAQSAPSPVHINMDCAADAAAGIASGMRLGAYRFDIYRTAKKPKDRKSARDVFGDVSIACHELAAAQKLDKELAAAIEGVTIARDLVHEPPNVLFPAEFARRIKKHGSKNGLKVEIFGETKLKKLGMGALLGVGQGSPRESQVAIMEWKGTKKSNAPVLAFVGKGVCFDTGGISLKPAANMDDMKGDMGGAACVTGLMNALAKRKAKVHAIGIVGLVENMPDGNAQRPGDIVKAMSGTTIEVLNTDAEGRLVLADALWYAQTRFKPDVVIDLATLTGAIIIALGQTYAGLFSNDDALAQQLSDAGYRQGEKLWRLPLDKDYDKMIDSKTADIKNIGGGRNAGSITAAQFLQRFIKDGTSWAHIDIAGVAMGSPRSPISPGWGSGFGVRLLDEFVRRYYEI